MTPETEQVLEKLERLEQHLERRLAKLEERLDTLEKRLDGHIVGSAGFGRPPPRYG